MTEEYSIGYDEGYQAGWNAAIDSVPPAAQRQWVGLTDDEWDELADKYGMIIFGGLKQEIEAKLKEKNT